jgi:Ca2+-binding RTX toxin-like protein
MIDGGAGNDTISGGGGDDILTGGADADTFVYFSASEGGDTLVDFNSGEDSIDLTALDLTAGGTVDPFVLGFVFIDGNNLFVDLDGGGPGELDDNNNPINDDILIATSGLDAIVDADVLV